MKIISFLSLFWLSLCTLTFTGRAEHPTAMTHTMNAHLLYVNKSVQGGSALGDSWENAIPELADAIEIAINDPSITEIWVAEGTYFPMYLGDGQYDSTMLYSSIFNIANLKLYGGFSGNELSREERNWKNNPTIISGNIGDPESNHDNLFDLIISDGATKETILDGFIVEKANGTKSTIQFANSTARHIINHCIIRNNRAMFGAVRFITMTNMIVANSLFLKNAGYQVGGIMNDSSVPVQVINTNFIGNSGQNGGAIENYGQLSIANSIFWSNRSNASTTHDIYTSDVANVFVANSLTQVYGDSSGEIVINRPTWTYPWFNDEYNDDYTLMSYSGAMNTGNNSLYDTALLGSRDLNGVDRIRNTTIDIGPYEVQEGDNPLPLTLISFTGQVENQQVHLTWKTTDEMNTGYFEVERSSDGKQFKSIGRVVAGQSGNHTYQFHDLLDDATREAYYRLKMVDLDGSYAYSQIKSIYASIENAVLGEIALKLYPQPFQIGQEVIIESTHATTATVFSMTGRLITQFELKKGRNIMPQLTLQSGLYLLQTDTGKTIKLMIQP